MAQEGRKTCIEMSGGRYDAVAQDRYVTTYQVDEYPHPVFAVATKNNDLVFMTKATDSLTNFALFSKVIGLQQDIRLAKNQYEELIFPMVDLKDTGEIAWLKGMVIGGKFISQALQQTMFKMNEYGAQAKSAVAIKLSRTAFVKVNKKDVYY